MLFFIGVRHQSSYPIAEKMVSSKFMQTRSLQAISRTSVRPFSLDDNFANVCWTLKRLILTHTAMRVGIRPSTFMLTLTLVGMDTTLYSWCIAVICFDNSNRIFISFVTGLQFQKTLLVDFSLPNVHVLMIASHKSINKQMIRRHFTAQNVKVRRQAFLDGFLTCLISYQKLGSVTSLSCYEQFLPKFHSHHLIIHT